MRVLHVTSGNLFGGIETFLVTLAGMKAQARGMESEFAFCFAGRLARELQAHEAISHCLGEVRTRFPWTLVRARRKLKQLLAARRYDVVVCHGSWPQAMLGPAVRGRHVPLVYFSHAPVSGRHWLDRWAGRVTPDLIICNSRYTQSSTANVYPGMSSEVVHLPVAPPLKFSHAERLAARSELETPEEAVVIIQVSRMEALKGHLPHLEALAKLPRNLHWIAWMVGGAQRAGESHYMATLKEKARTLGIENRIRFTGQRSDVSRLLAAADIFCQPNLSPDAFGISFVEALYAGLPVITTAMGGALEIVDVSCGILVSTESGTLPDALLQLVSDQEKRRRLAEAGPLRARDLCSPEKQMKQLECVLSSSMRRELGAYGDLRHA
ncbi:MAG TPA: glycosyltransferase family 4 protein [Candidatus Angelobacter sp.]|nr:glycosyltransferase family 4 protein [Candidatus Angelobacter sp.]